MKFPVDVNVGGRLSERLAAQGHDVRQVAGKDPGMLDEEVLNWAASEQMCSHWNERRRGR
ncbi:MAG: hypothetical protein PWP58_1019 [Bacillota bacterium]|nr:hypothetical protein [Bacillota bacterium]